MNALSHTHTHREIDKVSNQFVNQLVAFAIAVAISGVFVSSSFLSIEFHYS